MKKKEKTKKEIKGKIVKLLPSILHHMKKTGSTEKG